MRKVSDTDKTVLIRRIAAGLGAEFTDDQLVSAMRIISSSLADFEVEQSPDSGSGADADEMINAFLSAKELEGRSKKTLNHYRYVIRRFLNTVSVPIDSLTVFHIRKYLTDVKKSGSAA